MPAFSVPANFAFDSYTDLVGFINDWMDRNDLTGAAQSMIALAEARMRRELSPKFFEPSASVVTDAGVGALPPDCDFVRFVEYDNDTLAEMSPQQGRLLTGERPCAYSLEKNGIRVWPPYTGTVTVCYQSKLVSLSTGTPTNTLLSEHPDLYFYGALMFANGYVANDERAVLFKRLWDEAIDSANRFFRRQRSGFPRLPRPANAV